MGEEVEVERRLQLCLSVNSEQEGARGGRGCLRDAWLHSPKHGKPRLTSTRRSLFSEELAELEGRGEVAGGGKNWSTVCPDHGG